MILMADNTIQSITKAIASVKDYSNDVVEATVIKYVSEKAGIKFCYKEEFVYLENKEDPDLLMMFRNIDFPQDIEFIIEFFEALLDKENVIENGIVFTPRYIADYITKCVIQGPVENVKVIDPGCGCGIFLVSAAELIHEKRDCCIVKVLNENIYGIEIDEDNARRCKIVLNLYALLKGESNNELALNICCADSLKSNWNQLFDCDGFSCIIGNPPYVNTHDMSKETAKFLKKTFKTTKVGVYNIFYAFVEYAMNYLSGAGKLSYIVPNNFLTIKSATGLRELLAGNKWIEKIIDFSDNMVFKPIRTYNCIIQLSKACNEQFDYCVMEKTDDIPELLFNLELDSMEVDKLDANGWKLVDRHTMDNIHKIEGQFKSIKEFVRTGIATLKDDVYIVEREGEKYYKVLNGKKYIIEGALVKRLYKIPDLKKCDNIEEACRYIIFPYQKGEKGFIIISEQDIIDKTPLAYEYLKAQKAELDTRDKGKPNPTAWYAYGRTQGLNKYGKKLVFPTFACNPRFTMIDDEFSLFCNGYAVFENDYIALDILKRILNSMIMQYYVSNTSYAIDGGYYCYQKKYIEKFSLPYFTDEEKDRISEMTDQELDGFLINKYELDL